MARNSYILISKDIHLDKEHKNVLNYSSAQMVTLMKEQAHLIVEGTDFSFLGDKENKIIVPYAYGDMLSANYICFRNDTYSPKLWFAFVDKVEYNNNGSTIITFTIDWWATWYDQFQYKNAYVVREHVNDDTIGLHRQNEDLNVGDVVCKFSSYDASLSQYSWIAVMCAYNPDTQTGYDGVAIYNGSIFGKKMMLFQNVLAGWEELLHFILKVNADGYISSLSDMFIVPATLVDQSTLTQHTYTGLDGNQHTYYTPQYTDAPKTFISQFDKQYTWSEYTPKNNKLYCYPYNYLMVSNNNGSSAIYKYEDFSSANCKFDNKLSVSIGCSGILVPKDYKGQSECIDESLPLGKYPTCGWSADSYTNWLTQQAVNIPVSIITSTLGLAAAGAGGVAGIGAATTAASLTAGQISGVAGLSSQIGGLIGSFYQASLLPPIQGGGNTSDIIFTSGNNHFKFMGMRARPEFLKIIDDYFTRFGYKINEVKTPNISGRSQWNYVEIGQGENCVYGEMPADAQRNINQAFRNGVTIWHNHANIGNFSLTNSIV